MSEQFDQESNPDALTFIERKENLALRDELLEVLKKAPRESSIEPILRHDREIRRRIDEFRGTPENQAPWEELQDHDSLFGPVEARRYRKVEVWGYGRLPEGSSYFGLRFHSPIGSDHDEPVWWLDVNLATRTQHEEPIAVNSSGVALKGTNAFHFAIREGQIPDKEYAITRSQSSGFDYHIPLTPEEVPFLRLVVAVIVEQEIRAKGEGAAA